jgi:anti-sigma regulatory factor (Ser/Thr protein kinase)
VGTREAIVKAARAKGVIQTHDLVRQLGISRQTIAAHLKRLVQQGILQKTGSTHSAAYMMPKPGGTAKVSREIKLIKKLKGLHEDAVYEEVEHRLGLKRQLSRNVLSIAHYAFSEMLNNAIDHSKAPRAEITAKVDQGSFSFAIRDHGIGAFNNVKKSFRLASDYEAAEHLFKGKQTTMPARHSGQGIFFTSRIADRFVLRSNRLQALVDNDREDSYFSDRSMLKGTRVEFSIRQRSKKNLQKLFRDYADDDFEFDRNLVRINLTAGEELISRSQARRLLAGLESFKRVTFDFKHNSGIGQGFADEIFRVFAQRHPEIKLDYVNASPAVEFMIKRAQPRKAKGSV